MKIWRIRTVFKWGGGRGFDWKADGGETEHVFTFLLFVGFVFQKENGLRGNRVYV